MQSFVKYFASIELPVQPLEDLTIEGPSSMCGAAKDTKICWEIWQLVEGACTYYAGNSCRYWRWQRLADFFEVSIGSVMNVYLGAVSQ